MSGTINRVFLVGNLGRDPEVRSTQGGNKVCTLSVATSETWKDKDGNKKERTEWTQVVIFNETLCDLAAKYLRKGSKVGIEGSLMTNKWTDQAGVERWTTQVAIGQYRGTLTLLDASGNGRGTAKQQKSHDAVTGEVKGSAPPADFDDEIPF